MGRLINAQNQMPEGKLFNQYLKSRLIQHNKNVLVAVTGTTGSGKSYTCQRIAELWYKEHFHEQFPTERNTCFSIKEVMERLTDKDKFPLRRGELLIVEEAGTQLGNLDFQNKVSKIFSYVLQSFRSMNIGLLFNLPVFSMLNKSARLLVHAQFTTMGIDFDKKQSSIKPLFHQLNQQTGKIYPKYLKVRKGKSNIKVKRFVYSLPSPELIKSYEAKKFKFVSELNQDFLDDLRKMRAKEDDKLARDNLTDLEREDMEMVNSGMTYQQIADKRGVSVSVVATRMINVRKKGFVLNKKSKITMKNHNNHVNIATPNQLLKLHS